MPWKNATDGNLVAAGAIGTVPNNKRWLIQDFNLFNGSDSEKTIKVSIRLGAAGTVRQHKQADVESKGNLPLRLTQALPAGSQIQVNPGTGGSVNWILTVLEVPA